MATAVGIDLGTTFSAIAIVNKHGRPEIVPNREGEHITPSVVLFDGDSPIVGSMAKRSAIADPLNVVQFVKRQIGNPSWQFRTEEGETYTPEEISAMILKRLKEDAEVALGREIQQAVITVSAYFDDAQRKATHDAGRIAGLDVLRIINEPTAAALAYGFENVEKEETVLVYDLGGGTFDVTIIVTSRDGVKVLSTGGDRNLGGFNWDSEIMVYLNQEFQQQGGPDLLSNPAWEQELREKSEMAKKTLSSRDKTKVFLSADGTNATIEFSRFRLETLTESLIKRTGTIMDFVLEDAGLQWDDIGKILLVGGSTRMAAVPALIEAMSGKKPSMESHPDEIVALGAAIQAALLDGDHSDAASGALRETRVQDVNSHSMGVVALDDNSSTMLANVIVLKRGTHIPCKVSHLFQTVENNQTQLRVQITEGEDADLSYVTIVGESLMEIPPYPKGAPVEVFLAYDADGIIHVSVYDVTGQKMLGEFPIERKANLSESEIEDKKQRMAKKQL